MDELKGIGCAVLIAAAVLVAAFAMFGVAGVVGAIAIPIAIPALYIWLKSKQERRAFLRTAPSRIQDCMATMKDSLATATGHLETAVSELESGIAPLFWDAMDSFPQAIEQSTTAWNAAVDVAKRYERQRPAKATPLMRADAALPATVAELGGKWLDLRRRSLADQHFASIFEQRRQADKIADHLKEQRARIEAAVDAARHAELVASLV